MNFTEKIFWIRDEEAFRRLTLEAFSYQLQANPCYAAFVRALGVGTEQVNHYLEIPFLPVDFFKTQRVYASARPPSVVFRSSGTTGMVRSLHEVADEQIYRRSLLEGFTRFYGNPSGYTILALTPSPEDNPESSLAYMIRTWMDSGAQPGSGFYMNRYNRLAEFLQEYLAQQSLRNEESPGRGILLIGITYALLDFAEKYPMPLPGAVIMETGGMKGMRTELIREEVHEILQKAFGVAAIHSEYGMSELLSQAYSTGEGHFFTPPWMKILIRDANDPLSWTRPGRNGGISIIDLANWYSCPFVATGDVGKAAENGSVEVLGRFDNSDIRGCNLLFR